MERKNVIENYVEFDFRMVTVVIFLFFWMDNERPMPALCPLPWLHYVKFLISIIAKEKK